MDIIQGISLVGNILLKKDDLITGRDVGIGQSHIDICKFLFNGIDISAQSILNATKLITVRSLIIGPLADRLVSLNVKGAYWMN